MAFGVIQALFIVTGTLLVGGLVIFWTSMWMRSAGAGAQCELGADPERWVVCVNTGVYLMAASVVGNLSLGVVTVWRT